MANNAETDPTLPALLLTRPRERSVQFLNSLDRNVLSGVRVVISPLIDIVPLHQTPRLGDAAGAIFTSAQAVALAPSGGGLPAYCVGAQTAQAARDAGWLVDLTAQTANELISHMDKAVPPLVHFAGRHRRGDIAKSLNKKGLSTRVVVLYDQELLNLSDEAQALLQTSKRVIVPLFSPRTAARFLAQCKDTSGVEVVAMSPAVADQLREGCVGKVHVADAPTGLEVRRCVELRLRDTSLA